MADLDELDGLDGLDELGQLFELAKHDPEAKRMLDFIFADKESIMKATEETPVPNYILKAYGEEA